MTWVNINNFLSEYNINLDESIITLALNSSQKRIIDTIFLSKEQQLQGKSTSHIIECPIMNITGSEDGELVNEDIDLWEEEYSNNEIIEYDLNSNILSIENNRRSSKVITDIEIPTEDGRKVYVRYKTGKAPVIEMLGTLQRLQSLLAIDYIFTNVPFQKLQKGISSWSLNGVSVSFDLDAMQKVKENNSMVESELWNRLRAIRFDNITPGRGYFNRYQNSIHNSRWR